MKTPRNAQGAGGIASRPSRLTALLMATCGLLATAPALAYTWDYSPIIGTGISYETNPDYTSTSDLEDDAYAGFLDVTLNLSAETPRSRLRFHPRVRGSLYTGSENSSNLNAVDYYAPLEASWFSQRLQYALVTGYTSISTRDSEVFVTDPNQSGQTGSSGRVVNVDEEQDRLYFDPSVDFRPTARDELNVGITLEDVKYTQGELTGRSDYTYFSFRPTWSRSLGLTSKINASVYVDDFRADQVGGPVENDTLSYGIDAGYEYSLSDVSSVGVTLGTSRSDVSVKNLAAIDADNDPTTPPVPCFDPQQNEVVRCKLKSNESNFVGRIFYSVRTAETISTQFSIARDLQPNSDGAQVTQDSANAYITKDFTNTLSGSLGANYIRQAAVGKSVAGSLAQRFDRDYARLDASLNWHFARTWSTSANYSFSRDSQTSGGTYTTINNVVSLQLLYTGLGKH